MAGRAALGFAVLGGAFIGGSIVGYEAHGEPSTDPLVTVKCGKTTELEITDGNPRVALIPYMHVTRNGSQRSPDKVYEGAVRMRRDQQTGRVVLEAVANLSDGQRADPLRAPFSEDMQATVAPSIAGNGDNFPGAPEKIMTFVSQPDGSERVTIDVHGNNDKLIVGIGSFCTGALTYSANVSA